MKFRDFIAIISRNGFSKVRQNGDHHQFEGRVDGKRRMVTVAYSRGGDDIAPYNLASMIRQSGLPKKFFR